MSEAMKGRGEGIDQLAALGSELSAQERESIREAQNPPKGKDICRGCGRPSEKRWCSTSCFVQEDGGGDPRSYL